MFNLTDLKDSLKRILSEYDFMHREDVYEEYIGGYKYVVFLHKLYTEEDAFIYTKFIFYLDTDKKTIKKKYFKYLYDVNCKFQLVNFNDFSDLKEKIDEIFKTNDFGKGLKNLSKLVKTPATGMNEWFAQNDVTDISVEYLNYQPKVITLPCVSLFFNFDIEVNNNKIDLIIKKDDDGTFKLKFNIFDDEFELEKTSLDSILETICEILKEKLKK